MKEIIIRDDYIELNRLLKYAGLTDSGGQAGLLISSGEVRVNDKVEKRKKYKVRPGDLIHYRHDKLKIVKQESAFLS